MWSLTHGVLVKDGSPVPHPARRRHQEVVVVRVILVDGRFLDGRPGVTQTFVHQRCAVIVVIKQVVVVLGNRFGRCCCCRLRRSSLRQKSVFLTRRFCSSISSVV